MRLGPYRDRGTEYAYAITADDQVVDLTVAGPELPAAMAGILALGPGGLDAVQTAIDSGNGRRPLADVTLAAPVRPEKLFGIGLDNADHAAGDRSTPTRHWAPGSSRPTSSATRTTSRFARRSRAT